ncbi:MAG: response regulator transcription factor [Candidatus Pacebacteria bacterium]|nr:response regulator transcription factor [Candidatus Paceibacterota bacterium]
MRILIIEDNIDTRDLIKLSLESEGFLVEATSDGERGLYLAKASPFDLVILDLSLPRRNGISICKELRAIGDHVPILVISVTTELPAKILMLDSGADDYVTKPFEYGELLSRVRALLRRPKSIDEPIIMIDDLILNITSNRVSRGERVIYLTKKELNLLQYLMKHKGKVLSRGSILEHVWNANNDPYSNTVEAHILNLRKKIGRDGERELIHNVPGRGYKIDVQK